MIERFAKLQSLAEPVNFAPVGHNADSPATIAQVM
jgi:hypothetical protein